MRYSESFKNDVLMTFDNEEVEDMLENNDEALGQYLSDIVYGIGSITADDIIDAIENDDIDNLYERAMIQKEAGKLYVEWFNSNAKSQIKVKNL